MGKGFKFYLSKALRKFLNPPAIRDSDLDRTARVWNDSTVDNTTIGRYTYVSDHTLISSARIGAFCSVSSYCQIGGAAHPMDFVSSSPIFLEGHNAWDRHLANIGFDPYKTTVIGNDVWIGTHALVKSGVTVGDGAVIGMGSVVTKDVGPYEVWAGNPARLIKKRFDDETVAALLALKWWDLDDATLEKYSEYMTDPRAFIEKLRADGHTGR